MFSHLLFQRYIPETSNYFANNLPPQSIINSLEFLFVKVCLSVFMVLEACKAGKVTRNPFLPSVLAARE